MPAVSHAELHPLPQAELPGEVRAQIARLFEAQSKGVRWLGSAPVRYVEVDRAIFVREDQSKQLPDAAGRAALLGGGGALLGVMGAFIEAGTVSTVLLLAGAAGLAGSVYWLVQYPKHRAALDTGPIQHGVYVLDDVLVFLTEPTQVIHRPEPCGARIVPKGAITAVEVAPTTEGDRAAHIVTLRIRKATGEIVPYTLHGYPSVVRDHPLARILRTWIGGDAPSP